MFFEGSLTVINVELVCRVYAFREEEALMLYSNIQLTLLISRGFVFTLIYTLSGGREEPVKKIYFCLFCSFVKINIYTLTVFPWCFKFEPIFTMLSCLCALYSFLHICFAYTGEL